MPELLRGAQAQATAKAECMSGPLVTARSVAELLGVSTETVLRWTRRGELPAVRLPGGAIRYRPNDLDEWLEQRTTTRAERMKYLYDLPMTAKARDATDDAR
jgi:excisionase family DNA binding protein